MTRRWLGVALELARFEYMVKPVRAMIIKDVGSITIDGVEYSLEKGVEQELPRWSLRILESMDIANSAETGINIEDITRVHFSVMSARSPADLEPLPRDFYMETLDYIARLMERVRREFNPALLEEQQRAVQYLAEIIDRRLMLILQSLRSPTAIAEISSKLSTEEAALLDELRRDLETWKSSLSPEPK